MLLKRERGAGSGERGTGSGKQPRRTGNVKWEQNRELLEPWRLLIGLGFKLGFVSAIFHFFVSRAGSPL